GRDGVLRLRRRHDSRIAPLRAGVRAVLAAGADGGPAVDDAKPEPDHPDVREGHGWRPAAGRSAAALGLRQAGFEYLEAIAAGDHGGVPARALASGSRSRWSCIRIRRAAVSLELVVRFAAGRRRIRNRPAEPRARGPGL